MQSVNLSRIPDQIVCEIYILGQDSHKKSDGCSDDEPWGQSLSQE